MKYPITLLAVSSLGLAACSDLDLDNISKQQEGAVAGGLIGAIVGAGAARDGKETRGAVIGGVVGAAAGSAIGARLDAQEEALRGQIGNGDVKIVNTGSELIVTMPQDILFAFNSSELRPDLQSDIRALAGNLQEFPDTTVQVIGHTDNVGTAEFNQALSERRAQAVSSILLQQGVSSSRVRSIGRGEADPVDSNLTDEGRAQNRRVEFVITPIV